MYIRSAADNFCFSSSIVCIHICSRERTWTAIVPIFLHFYCCRRSLFNWHLLIASNMFQWPRNGYIRCVWLWSIVVMSSQWRTCHDTWFSVETELSTHTQIPLLSYEWLCYALLQCHCLDYWTLDVGLHTKWFLPLLNHLFLQKKVQLKLIWILLKYGKIIITLSCKANNRWPWGPTT